MIFLRKLFYFSLIWINISILSKEIKKEILEFPFWDLTLLSKSAPTNYYKASLEKLPMWIDYEKLEIKKFIDLPPGKYNYKDSELVIWGNGIFQWYLPDGTIFDSRSDGYRSIEKKGYKFEMLGKVCVECNGKQYLYYPDGSRLEKYIHPISKRIEFNYYNNKDDGLHRYTMYEPGYWAGNYFNEFNLELYYSDSWKAYVEKFINNYIYFQKYFEQELGFNNPGKIPILLLEDKKKIQELLNSKNINSNGGHAGTHSIVLCCGNSMKQLNHEINFNSLFNSLDTHYLIIHELTHNYQQSKCMAIKRIKIEGPYLEIPVWFTEGIAVFVAMQFDNKIKKVFYNEFQSKDYYLGYEKLKKYDYGSKELYIIGGMVIEFISKTYGNKTIQEIHDELCSGIDSDDIVFRKLGYDTGELLKKSVDYFKKNGDSLLFENRRD
jgi:hypothetical protein